MKNLIVDMFRRKNAKIKADSEKYKEEVAKVAKQVKQTPEKTLIQEKEVMKESKTLMLD